MSFNSSYHLHEDDDIVTLLTILSLSEQDSINEDIYKLPNEELEAVYDDDVDIRYYTDKLYKALKSVYDSMCTYKRESEQLELANNYLRSQANAYGINKILSYSKVEQSKAITPSYFYSTEFISSQLYEDEGELFSS